MPDVKVTSQVPAQDLATQALHLAPVRPKSARQLSSQAERESLAARDWASVSVARRAAGVAAIQLRALDEAVTKLREAVHAARRAGDDRLAGEANMSLAAALMLSGATARAFSAIENALATLHDLPAARARSQRAAMLWEQGRLDEALDDLRLALPVLRRSSDVQWEVRALANRSLILGARRQFAAAEADLLRARDLCTEHELTLSGAIVEQNLGCIHSDRGDVARALEHFDAASVGYRELGSEVGSLLLDRARVLLGVRLLEEARAGVEAAVRVFGAQHNSLKLPEAQLMLSTTALLQGDADVAVAAARAAARSFTRLGRTSWAVLARYADVQARQLAARVTDDESRTRQPATAERIRRAATDLEKAGWVVPALEARVLAARIALDEGRREAARRDLARAARGRRSGPADARARAWFAEALLREAEGSRRGAKVALRTGIRVLSDHRASLGATELRAHVSVHRGALARAGLRMALQDGDPRAVHWWSECSRASADLLRPVRPPEDPEVAHDLQDLRATMTEIDQARSTGAPDHRLVARQVQLERAIRDRTRRSTEGLAGDSLAPPALTVFAEELGETALVEYAESDGSLFAVTLVERRAQLHRLGAIEPVRHAVDHLSFALRRLARHGISERLQASATTVMEHAAATLDAALIEPLREAVEDRELTIVPVGWLQSVPWSVLPACAGRPVSVAPSATLWRLAGTRAADPRSPVVAVAGPHLAAAEEESRAVAGLYERAHEEVRCLTGEAAVASAVASAMSGARVAHIAAHGTVRADNPLFSSLLLADGPFTVYDLERLGRTPHQVILAVCNSALAHVTAGEEILGLSAALLTQHTATLIAPVVPIPDAETLPVMTSYHEQLLAGRSPAAALAAAQQQHRDADVRTRVSATGFVCLGAGHAAPSHPARPVTREG